MLARVPRRPVGARPANRHAVVQADCLGARKPTPQPLALVLKLHKARHIPVHGLNNCVDDGLLGEEPVLDSNLARVLVGHTGIEEGRGNPIIIANSSGVGCDRSRVV